MRPSVSVTLEPVSERGVPWGRDLYTFVTSAAGHMMRTLQKPRKNRPSKRQVNHRRFLHNMIQRKFADIEAANHRLASALYFKEEKKNASSLQSQKPEMSDRSDSPLQTNHRQQQEKNSIHTDADNTAKPTADASVVPDDMEVTEKKRLGSRHIWKCPPKSQSATCDTRRDNRSRGRHKRGNENHKLVELVSSPKGIDQATERCDDDNQLKAASVLWEHQKVLQDSAFTPAGDLSPSFSPALSPLSLDSCDFSIQMLADISACTHTPKSIGDIAESQWTDIMDLFSGGDGDAGGCMDVDAYFASICSCQEAGAEEFPFSGQSDSLTESTWNGVQSEDPHCEYRHVNGDQGLSGNYTDATPFNRFKPAQTSDMAKHLLHTSISSHCPSQLQMLQRPQEESDCVLGNGEDHLHFTPFEGIAQSFSAPLHNAGHRPIPTPPREDDWLFTDILKDGRESPGC